MSLFSEHLFFIPHYDSNYPHCWSIEFEIWYNTKQNLQEQGVWLQIVLFSISYTQ